MWIKRNLFMAVGGFLALLLLGGGIFYLVGAIQKNNQIEEQLRQAQADLENLSGKAPSPHATNVDAAKEELLKAQKAINQTHQFFLPLPVERSSRQDFRSLLDKTIAELQKKAAAAGVTLASTNYGFSFSALRNETQFSPDSFPALPEQLAEVKAICDILFAAKVKPLVNLRRARVSVDDRELNADYHELKITTNESAHAMLSPYEVTFLCLSAELAAAIEGFHRSPYGFLVQAIQVEPLEKQGVEPGAPPAVVPATTPPRPTAPPPPGSPRPVTRPPPPAAGTPPASDTLATLFKEKRFKTTLLIQSIKPVK